MQTNASGSPAMFGFTLTVVAEKHFPPRSKWSSSLITSSGVARGFRQLANLYKFSPDSMFLDNFYNVDVICKNFLSKLKAVNGIEQARLWGWHYKSLFNGGARAEQKIP